jgi:hypothetical protein
MVLEQMQIYNLREIKDNVNVNMDIDVDVEVEVRAARMPGYTAGDIDIELSEFEDSVVLIKTGADADADIAAVDGRSRVLCSSDAEKFVGGSFSSTSTATESRMIDFPMSFNSVQSVQAQQAQAESMRQQSLMLDRNLSMAVCEEAIAAGGGVTAGPFAINQGQVLIVALDENENAEFMIDD